MFAVCLSELSVKRLTLSLQARRPRPGSARDGHPATSVNNNNMQSHITIIPRRIDPQDSETETPVRTNPSYLAETDAGLDLHKRDSYQPHNHATFADMARSGLGIPHESNSMASDEPQAMSSFVRFKKPQTNGRPNGSNSYISN